MDRSGESQVVGAFLKIIGGASLSDNFEHGMAGNYLAHVSAETGSILDVVIVEDGEVIVAPPSRCQKIRIPADFQVPLWEQTRAVVEDCATKIRPTRTLGWDVAVTPQGPLILEGNRRWDPYPHPAMSKILDAILKR